MMSKPELRIEIAVDVIVPSGLWRPLKVWLNTVYGYREDYKLWSESFLDCERRVTAVGLLEAVRPESVPAAPWQRVEAFLDAFYRQANTAGLLSEGFRSTAGTVTFHFIKRSSLARKKNN